MDSPSLQSREIWTLVARQHGVVARWQLLALGLSPPSVKHRVATGRLHPLARGVYAVGRPQVTRHGRWIAALLSCGPRAVLSHSSAAALWALAPERSAGIEVSVPLGVRRRRPGIVLHQRSWAEPECVSRHQGVPSTSAVCTLVDLAPRLGERRLEAAVNEADKRDLIDPDALRAALDDFAGWPGVRTLRRLDARTFTLTDSELERRFLPIARRAGLPVPRTGQYANGFKVDLSWPELGLVVETDGLRYHRTPAQQARDRLRDQAHAAAGLTPLRFTRAQVAFEPDHVHAVLVAVVTRLSAPR